MPFFADELCVNFVHKAQFIEYTYETISIECIHAMPAERRANAFACELAFERSNGRAVAHA